MVDGRIIADFPSVNGNEDIVLEGASLRPGVYYIALGMYSTGVAAVGFPPKRASRRAERGTGPGAFRQAAPMLKHDLQGQLSNPGISRTCDASEGAGSYA